MVLTAKKKNFGPSCANVDESRELVGCSYINNVEVASIGF